MAILSSVASTHRLNHSTKNEVGARYLAEAGLAEAVHDLRLEGSGNLGSNGERVEYGGGDFWVECTDLGGGLMSLIATGVQGRSAARVELVVQTQADGLFSWGAFGDEGLAMSSNAHVDSYDSRLGSYADQQVNGNGNDAWANDEGNVGSNTDILLLQNASVMGNAVPGPSGTATVMGNAVVSGTTTPASDQVDMPEIELPTTVSSGPLTISSNGSQTLGAGEHAFDAFLMETGGTLTIEGPATVVFQSVEMKSNSELVIEATGGGGRDLRHRRFRHELEYHARLDDQVAIGREAEPPQRQRDQPR